VATNAAGRAAVTGLTPTAGGAVQISASAAFQGQTAATTIARTNVLTAAEAAAVSGAAGSSSGGSAAGSAGGAAGGGGLSTTTLVVAGAAVAGGAVAATKVLGGGDTFSGPLNFQMTETYNPSCTTQYAYTTELKMTLSVDGTSVSGKAGWGGRRDFVSTTCSNLPETSKDPITSFGWSATDPTVTGSTTSISFHHEPSNRTDPRNFTCDCGQIWDFTGALNGHTITGAADYSSLLSGVVTGRVRLPVNITKQ